MSKQLLDVMIDIETMGINVDAPILSIGAVYFDPKTGETGKTFEMFADFETGCRNRNISPSTIKWWFEQNATAKARLLSGKSKPSEMFNEFAKFIRPDARVWGNGATFDISLIENSLEFHNIKTPWKFWNVRDVRTVVQLGEMIGIDRGQFKFEGTSHTPLADALHQVRYVSAMIVALTCN